MTTVYNEIDKVGGDPLKRIVKIELLWDKAASTVALVESEKSMILGEVIFEASVHGKWSVDLVPNADITPASSVYRVTYSSALNDTRSAVSYFISVEESTDEVWAGDIITGKPVWVVN